MPATPLIPAASIASRIAELGARISQDYAGQSSLEFLVLMDGAFMFAADLARAVEVPDLRLHFVRASSYVGTASSGTVTLGALPPVTGRPVLIVDDILDTGLTLGRTVEAVQAAGATSVRTCVLLDKTAGRRPGGLERADYVGFPIPDAFVIGYGLDYDGRFRHLPDVCVWQDDGSSMHNAH
jgi:hypoxanthine phosphoribosyltransferase